MAFDKLWKAFCVLHDLLKHFVMPPHWRLSVSAGIPVDAADLLGEQGVAGLQHGRVLRRRGANHRIQFENLKINLAIAL